MMTLRRHELRHSRKIVLDCGNPFFLVRRKHRGEFQVLEDLEGLGEPRSRLIAG